MDPAIEQAKRDLGVTEEAIGFRLRQCRSFQEQVAVLDDLKREAKKTYRRLAFDLHPDRTGGDEVKLERFKALSRVMEAIEQLQIRPPPIVTHLVPGVQIRFYTNGPVTTSNSATTTTSGSSGATYVRVK